MNEDLILIHGKNAVIEAIKKRPDALVTVFVRQDILKDEALAAKLRRLSDVELFTNKEFPKRAAVYADDRVAHQGMMALLDATKLLQEFTPFLKQLNPSPDTALLILGEVQDPHNVGAIIRSAAAFGFSAVLMPEHRGCPVTGTVIKTSAGAAFSVPLVRVANINRTLQKLREHNFKSYGLAGEGDASLTDMTFNQPTVFVVGNEGKGIREKTREECDQLLSIPIHPRVESLNASVSAAVLAAAWSAQHQAALK